MAWLKFVGNLSRSETISSTNGSVDHNQLLIIPSQVANGTSDSSHVVGDLFLLNSFRLYITWPPSDVILSHRSTKASRF